MNPEKTVGVQSNGSSSDPIYQMAFSQLDRWNLPSHSKILDLGGGAGNFAVSVAEQFQEVHLVDYAPEVSDERVMSQGCNLNEDLPYENESFDAVVSLEVIEHLENPRHFFREVCRLLAPGGYCFITTPSLVNISSKLSLLMIDRFQQFQDQHYPSHITPILPIDLMRIAQEVGLEDRNIMYTNDGRIPFSTFRWQLLPFAKGKWFSDNLGLAARKPPLE